jgi:2-methylisocitrate lyase-like PEP mutase family enzyme
MLREQGDETITEKRAAFRALHGRGCFMLPNPWDIGSARVLQSLGFAVLATTSSEFAWSHGTPDYAVSLDSALAHYGRIVEAVDLPINADFEAGFSPSMEGVLETVRRAIDTGICGISTEDRDLAKGRLWKKRIAVERLKAARTAVDATGKDVILAARTEGSLVDPAPVSPAIDKLVAFAEVGADCLYAPGVWKKADIQAMVRAVAPKPLNVLALGAELDFQTLADLGVRRVGNGGSLSLVGWKAIIMNADEGLKRGPFAAIKNGASRAKPNELFGRFS